MRRWRPTLQRSLARGELHALAALLTCIGAACAAHALPSHQAEGAIENGVPGVRATLLVDLAPRASVGRAGVRFELAPGWHLYWRNPGDTGLAPRIRFRAEGADARFGELAWPTPRAFREDVDILTFGYQGSVLLAAPVELTAGAAPRSISAEADVLVCAEQCVPATLQMRRDVIGPADAETTALFEQSAMRVPAPARERGVRTVLEWPGEALRPAGPTARFEAALRVSPCAGARGCDLVPPPRAVDAFFPYAPTQALLQVSGVEREEDGGYRVSLRGEALEPLPADAALRGVINLRDPKGGSRAFEVALPLARAEALGGAAAASAPLGLSALLRALGLGVLGGLLLNLMPCVLPVLAIKLFAVAELGQHSRRQVLAHALAYTAGILATLGALALVVVALRWSGTAVGWGFHLQEPLFVVLVAAVVVVFAMNLLGAFEFELGTGALAELGAGAVGARRSFFDGLLAVVLATPCSAPFLGTAIGFAFASPAPVILAIFLAIGLGLAAPFLAIAIVPAGARLMPRAGPWMLELRRGLGFALIATALWLVWIIGRTAGIDAMTAVLFLLLAIAFASWSFGLIQRRRRASGILLVLAVTGLLVSGLGSIRLERDPQEDRPAPADAPRAWSHEALRTSLAEGRPVFAYFTADWCLTCKVNESRVLSDPQVGDALARAGFEVLRADWTRRDETIRAELASLGRAGVPVYALYSPERPDDPRLLPELLGREGFLNAIAEIAEETGRSATR
jgi:thiol:disulfide interchange protein DsbD